MVPDMRLLYTILYALGFVLLIPAFLYKMWRRGKYKENFLQRFGCYAPDLFRPELMPVTWRRFRSGQTAVCRAGCGVCRRPS